MTSVNYTPSTQLLKAFRACLILEDSSLNKWASANGLKRQNLTKALVGNWKGPKADRVVAKALKHLNNESTQ